MSVGVKELERINSGAGRINKQSQTPRGKQEEENLNLNPKYSSSSP